MQLEIPYFPHLVLRACRSLATIRNVDEHYGRSRPLRNQSECAKYLCHVINNRNTYLTARLPYLILVVPSIASQRSSGAPRTIVSQSTIVRAWIGNELPLWTVETSTTLVGWFFVTIATAEPALGARQTVSQCLILGCVAVRPWWTQGMILTALRAVWTHWTHIASDSIHRLGQPSTSNAVVASRAVPRGCSQLKSTTILSRGASLGFWAATWTEGAILTHATAGTRWVGCSCDWWIGAVEARITEACFLSKTWKNTCYYKSQ